MAATRRKSLADLVPDDLPEDVGIPDHPPRQPAAHVGDLAPPKRATRGRKAKADTPDQAAAEPAPDGAESHEGAPEEQTAEEKPRRPRRAPTARPKLSVDDGVNYPRRVTLPLTNEDYKALNLAKLEDDVNVVTRLRAMIDLWQTNSRIRDQIDRHARRMR